MNKLFTIGNYILSIEGLKCIHLIDDKIIIYHDNFKILPQQVLFKTQKEAKEIYEKLQEDIIEINKYV